MAQDPQHILREPDGTVRGYIFANSNNNIVIEHAGSGEQAILGSDGLSASGIASDPHDNTAHSETYATESYADSTGGVSDHSELTGVGANDHHSPPTGTQSEQINSGYQVVGQSDEKDVPADDSTVTFTIQSNNKWADGIEIELVVDGTGGLSLDRLEVFHDGGGSTTVFSGSTEISIDWIGSYNLSGVTVDYIEMDVWRDSVYLDANAQFEGRLHTPALPEHTHNI